MTLCPECAAPSQEADRFCEACGADLRPKPQWLSSSAPAGGCPHCGVAPLGPEGYCERCGRRRGAGRDRAELDFGRVAAVTDRGLHRRHNEDAVAIGQLDGAAVAIVCDGVSTSSHADDAAHAAADAGIDALLRELADGVPPAQATEVAFRAAFSAVALLCGPDNRHNPPSCTYVSAVVTADTVTVGWVGDSRAYWVAAPGAAGSRCLTDDDTLVGQSAAAGVAIDPHLTPQALALTRWVGADAGAVEPRVRTLDRPAPGSLILCSDGLSRYLAGPADLAVVASDPPALAARRLTQLALDAGGGDNIAVAVAPFPLSDSYPSGAPTR